MLLKGLFQLLVLFWGLLLISLIKSILYVVLGALRIVINRAV